MCTSSSVSRTTPFLSSIWLICPTPGSHDDDDDDDDDDDGDDLSCVLCVCRYVYVIFVTCEFTAGMEKYPITLSPTCTCTPHTPTCTPHTPTCTLHTPSHPPTCTPHTPSYTPLIHPLTPLLPTSHIPSTIAQWHEEVPFRRKIRSRSYQGLHL